MAQPPAACAHNKRDPGYEAADPRFLPGQPHPDPGRCPPGHTRLAGYLRDNPGVITAVNGYWVYPDANANGSARREGDLGLHRALRRRRPVARRRSPRGPADLFEPYLREVDPDARPD